MNFALGQKPKKLNASQMFSAVSPHNGHRQDTSACPFFVPEQAFRSPENRRIADEHNVKQGYGSRDLACRLPAAKVRDPQTMLYLPAAPQRVGTPHLNCHGVMTERAAPRHRRGLTLPGLSPRKPADNSNVLLAVNDGP